MTAPDPFAVELWRLYDSEREAKRTRPLAAVPDAHPGTFPLGGGPVDVITITDPDKYAASALERTVQELSGSPEGGRNHALNAAAFALGRLVGGQILDETDATDALLEACEANGLADEDGAHACLATIRSGLRGGQRDPLEWVQGDARVLEFPGVPVPDNLPTWQPEPVDPQRQANLALASELISQRARREAKRLLDAEEAAATFRVPPSAATLREELLIPEQPITYAIEELLPAGGNALLTAQFKAGKTSTVNNLIRSFCDGTPFLGKYRVHPAPGRIAVFNYEVGDDLYRKWLRELNIQHPERAALLNLRGFRLPVTVPSVEDWVVNWLVERQVTFWIVDPFARAFTGCGDNENDNGQVGLFLDTLDVIKARAGVRDLVMPTHTGRAEVEPGQERSRGATRLEDWADVRWLLTQVDNEDGPPQRFFRATGRDVEVPESALLWNEDDRSQRHTGGDRKWVAKRAREQAVLDHVNANQGCSFRSIKDAVKGGDNEIRAAIAALSSTGHMHVEKAAGVGKSDAHRANRTTVLDGVPALVGGFPSVPGEEAR